jgi:UDP-N-acetylmuramoyl-tripeptide--D-alanyl-D-alanine ligase
VCETTLVVNDTLAALGRLAMRYRHAVLPISTAVIAVTGSNGKTTTKCMIDHILSGEFNGRSSPKSFNNAIGVPLTLLSASADPILLSNRVKLTRRWPRSRRLFR